MVGKYKTNRLYTEETVNPTKDKHSKQGSVQGHIKLQVLNTARWNPMQLGMQVFGLQILIL